MTRTTFALSTAGILLLAVWAQAPAGPAHDAQTPSPAAVAAAVQATEAAVPVARGLEGDADRLRAALAAVRPYAPPARNPFTFHAKPEARSRVAPAAAGVALPPAPPAAPAVRYPSVIALVADPGAAGVSRRAMLEYDGESALVSVGEAFARFQVRAIGESTVELVDITHPAKPVITLSIR